MIICWQKLSNYKVFLYTVFVKLQKFIRQKPLASRHSIMILKSSYDIKINKKYTKILYLYAAFNETFVILGLLADKRDGLAHIDRNGKVLFQHYFQKAMDSIGMIDEKEVILIQTRFNRISIFNLETHQFCYFPHQFMNEQSDQSQIFTFSQTKYICIQQKGRYNDNRYKLTYFSYPLKLHQIKEKKITKSIAIYEAKQAEWTYEYMTRKANSYSMMCWFKPRHDDSFQFKTYQIMEGKGLYKIYRFNTPISVEPHITKMQTAVLSVWELNNKNILFICLSNKSENKKGGTVINDNYVIDLNKKQIRQSKFTFGPYQDYLIDYFNLGLYSMVRTYKQDDGGTLTTPTYYIDNQSEAIIAQQLWECSSQFKYEFPAYGSNIICQGLYDCTDNDRFQLNLKRIFHAKDLYIHLIVNSSGVQISDYLIEDMLCVLGVPLN